MAEKTLNRVSPVTPEQAGPEVKEIYNHLSRSMGKVLNIFQNLGNSPAALTGFLAFNDALNRTSLSPQLREKIALAVAQANECNYCLSAHTLGGKHSGISNEDIILARKGESSDKKTQAILKFVKLVVQNRGKVTDDQVAQLKSAGISDKELTEIILAINVNIFTNYFNLVTGTELDLPEAPQL